MPSLETPPKSVPPTQPIKVRTGRYGELEEHELVHLLDSLDDERSKARFRESIYISIIIYAAICWFLFYGPRVLFHQPRLINPVDAIKEHEKQLTFLDDPKTVSKLAPKSPKAAKEQPRTPPTRPTLDKKTLDQLKAMRKAATPLPPAPTPQPPAPAQQQPTPPTPQPPPAPQPTQQALVEAPKPAPSKPNFGNPNQTAGDAIRQAAQNAARDHGSSGGDLGGSASGGRSGMGTGVDILSDTQGVDFGPYIRRILGDIRRNWIPLIPEEARPPLNKQGETLIRFTILPDGRIAAMNLDGSSQDTAIDRACWGGITGVGQFPPLPANFHGPNLELRIDFLTNKPLPNQ
ncbi:TonB C-terminal domain-containing protein [Granulicella sp. L60]|uniref:TonB C-terminal domain-containing protein n=1 Tax=Granulicella sp. L60 TaxID=1641866 RepID=UPI00131D989C|nr:TonB C-terminal domain-containing protein [Granulicella sp. L60]